MTRTLRSAWAFSSILMIAAFALPTVAGETKKFTGRGTLVTIQMSEQEVAGQSGVKPSLSSFDGTLLSDDRNDPLNGSRYQVVGVYDGKDRDVGYKTFTGTDGSMLFGTYEVTLAAHPQYKGTIQITGGTGKFKGVTGKGGFVNTFISDKVAIDEVELEYNIP